MIHGQHVSYPNQVEQTSAPGRGALANVRTNRAQADVEVTGKILPIVLDVGPWGQTIAGSPNHACDIIATIAAASFVRFGRDTGMDARQLLVVTDTSTESRLLTCVLRETGLEHCQVTTYDDVPGDISGRALIVVSATANNSFGQTRRCCGTQTLLSCIVCNAAAKDDGFRRDATDKGARILEVNADLLRAMVGSDARWASSLRGLPPGERDWVPAATIPQDARRSLFMAPRSDHTITISSRTAGHGSDASLSLTVDLPQTMSLFLLEGLALDPFYAASTFHTCGITSDLDGCSVRPVPASRKRMDTNHVCSNPTASPPSHRTVGAKHVIVPEDRSRHYEDDQWYETEAEKDAQDRRQGGKFSYSDLGVRRQRHGWHATQEQTLELLKRRGTAGKD